MKVLMNSAVIPVGCYGCWEYHPASWSEIRDFLADGDYQSYIGYEETADMIERMTGVRPTINREVATLNPGDLVAIVRLRYRVVPGQKGQFMDTKAVDYETAFMMWVIKDY